MQTMKEQQCVPFTVAEFQNSMNQLKKQKTQKKSIKIRINME